MPVTAMINPRFPRLRRRNALNFEANRLATFGERMHFFISYISTLKLAQNGFYATGNGNEVECFRCGVRHSRWGQDQLNARALHGQISPNCPFAHGQDHAGQFQPNIPIPNEENHQPPTIVTNSLEDSARLNARCGVQVSSGEEDSDISLTPHALVVGGGNLPAGQEGTAENFLPRQSDGSPPFTARVEGQQAVNPQFATEEARRGTFSGFPRVRENLVPELIRHGFFYVGHDDIVLCFCCGLGLKDWEAADDPRIAHMRWSPDCQHVLAVERDTTQERTRREMDVVGAAGGNV